MRRPRSGPTALIVVGLLATATVAAGCGGDGARRLQTADVEDEIASTIESDSAITVDQVNCPDDRPARKGDVFVCRAVIEGKAVEFRVTQEDGEGNFRARSTRAILDMKRAESEMGRSLSRQLEASVEVACGRDRVRIQRAGDQFDCLAVDEGGGTAAVKVTVKDIAGNISFEVVE